MVAAMQTPLKRCNRGSQECVCSVTDTDYVGVPKEGDAAVERTQRLARILSELEQHGRLTASRLADTLNVSPRTIYRDMDTLMASGVPVKALPGLDGGYGLSDESEMRPILLTPTEALALSLGASLVAALPQPGLAAAADRGAERLWPVAAQGPALPEVRRRYLALAPALAGEPQAVMLTVLHAVIKGRQVVVTPLSGERAVRLDPYGLTYRNGTWHLVAQAEDASEPALYPLTAIGTAEPSPRPAAQRSAADGKAAAGQVAVTDVDPRFSTHVRMRLSGPLARELRHSVLFRGLAWQLEQENAVVELQVDDPGPVLQLAWERADAVEILAPDRWRMLLQMRARRCLERYANAV